MSAFSITRFECTFDSSNTFSLESCFLFLNYSFFGLFLFLCTNHSKFEKEYSQNHRTDVGRWMKCRPYCASVITGIRLVVTAADRSRARYASVRPVLAAISPQFSRHDRPCTLDWSVLSRFLSRSLDQSRYVFPLTFELAVQIKKVINTDKWFWELNFMFSNIH